MSQFLGGRWDGEAFEWKTGEVYDLREDFVVQLFIPTARVFGTSEEARDFAAHLVRNLDWCSAHPGKLWSFNFDKLRKRLSFTMPEWLTGEAATVPMIRPVSLEVQKPGDLPKLDTLEISCRFVQRHADPTVEAVLESANRPPGIEDSLSHFRQAHPDPARVAFVMMTFGNTELHRRIYAAIAGTLARSGIAAVRADAQEFHPNLMENILTYIHGCRFGIAVFERLVGDEFNPNISLEVGYMLAMRKPLCLLKDATLRNLHTDLMGRIYRSFDPQSPETTIPGQIEAWMREKGLLRFT